MILTMLIIVLFLIALKKAIQLDIITYFMVSIRSDMSQPSVLSLKLVNTQRIGNIREHNHEREYTRT